MDRRALDFLFVGGNTVNEPTQQFLLKEFDQLREELLECIKESRLLERNALLASGAIWAWAIANKSQSVYQTLLLVPPLIVSLSGLRAWSLSKHIGHLAAYIQEVENAFALPTGLGWEHVFAKSTDYSKSASAIIFWLVLLAATLFAAVWYR